MHKLNLDNNQDRTLPRLLQLQARHNAEQKFLITESLQLSFHAAYDKACRLASGLQHLGLNSGDNIALFLNNRPETVLLAIAANMLGAIWVPINTDYKGAWLQTTLDDSKAKILVTQNSLYETHADVIDQISGPQLLILDTGGLDMLLEHPPYQTELEKLYYGDTSAIMWTSGTTGKSKGVMVSHNNWLRPIIDGSSLMYDSEPGDIIMNVLPMYHAAAWNTAILRALVEGIPVVIEPRFSVSNFWQRVNQFGATQAFTLGAMHMFLWNAPAKPSLDKNTLRCLQAVPMPEAIRADFEQRFALQIIGSGYGQSECMMIITTAGFDTAPPNSMGYAARDLDIKLLDDNHQEIEPGEIGEICVKPHQPYTICNGYFNDAIATQAAWQDDWFHTGDLARQIDGGAYFFADRKKDAVRYAGRNISTLEVESVVRQHPLVKDVAAFGIPSDELDCEDELALAVVVSAECDMADNEVSQDIANYISDNAPHYFVPRYITVVTELPYTPTNKVQKFKLRESGVQAHTWDRKQSQA